MRIHVNGERFQVCNGGKTLTVVDTLEEAIAYISQAEVESRKKALERYEAKQQLRERLQVRRYWRNNRDCAGYAAVCAALLGMLLCGQRNEENGRATVFASGAEAPPNWRECCEQEKQEIIDRFVEREFGKE